jgi:hypothetical protein
VIAFMRARTAAACLLAFLAAAGPAWAGDPIMGLGELRSGMRCTGYTVVRGTEPVGFDVEVLDVLDGDPASADGPRILVRVSGPAVDATGVGPGFSGSPIYCPDAAGTSRNIGAISESIGEYGGKVVLATPIEAILGTAVDTPAARPTRTAKRARAIMARAKPLIAPLTVSGLSRPLARMLATAGRRAGRPVLSVPAGPLNTFPVQPLRPGSAMGVGLSFGDLTIGGVGTVAYVDGDRVWAFGHPFDNAGRRALLLQDAYVFQVINNPNQTSDQGTTYKLAAAAHPVGTITNDALSAVAGRTGALPTTIPVRIVAHDLDTDRRRNLLVHVADESDLDDPFGSSSLTLVAPLAVSQAASTALGSTPARQTAEMCVRINLRERRAPLRFCNRYVSTAVIAGEDVENASVVAARAATDVLDALTFVDQFKAARVHVTGVSALIRMRRGARQAFIRAVRVPRKVRPGKRFAVRMLVQPPRAAARVLRFSARLPSATRAGRRRVVFSGVDVDSPDGEFLSSLTATIEIGEEEEANPGELGPASVDELADAIAQTQRYDGVTMRVGRERVRAYRDAAERLSGRVTATVRVVRR